MAENPTGLYWLGPLLWSLLWALAVLGTVAFLLAVSSPEARRNRARRRRRG